MTLRLKRMTNRLRSRNWLALATASVFGAGLCTATFAQSNRSNDRNQDRYQSDDSDDGGLFEGWFGDNDDDQQNNARNQRNRSTDRNPYDNGYDANEYYDYYDDDYYYDYDNDGIYGNSDPWVDPYGNVDDQNYRTQTRDRYGNMNNDRDSRRYDNRYSNDRYGNQSQNSRYGSRNDHYGSQGDRAQTWREEQEWNRQRQQDWERQQQRQARYGRTHSGQMNSQQQIRGEIVELQTVDIFKKAHQLAKIKQDNGRTVIVDLGQKNKLSKLNLDKGDRILVTGQQTLLSAVSVHANNKSVTVESRRNRTSTSSYRDSNNSNRYSYDGNSDRYNSSDRYDSNRYDDDSEWSNYNGSAQYTRSNDRNDRNSSGWNNYDGSARYNSSNDSQYDRNRNRGQQANRWSQQNRNSSSNFGYVTGDESGKNLRVNGRIQTLVTREIDDEDHLVAFVDDQGDRLRRVDLGAKDDLDDVDLDEGDHVQIRGHQSRDGASMMLVADRIRVTNRSDRYDSDQQNRWNSTSDATNSSDWRDANQGRRSDAQRYRDSYYDNSSTSYMSASQSDDDQQG